MRLGKPADNEDDIEESLKAKYPINQCKHIKNTTNNTFATSAAKARFQHLVSNAEVK
ncbi:hypothetical protein GCM10027181_32970 [Rheinheimera gaetbuli]